MNDRIFNQWLQQVDAHVVTMLGCSIWDMPDMGYRDLYDDGMSAHQTALEVVAENVEHEEYGGAFDGFAVSSDADPGL
jgi:hypothetical protein